MEMVQHRVAKFVVNNFDTYASVSEMINKLQWPTLEQRRTDLTSYKIGHNLHENW